MPSESKNVPLAFFADLSETGRNANIQFYTFV